MDNNLNLWSGIELTWENILARTFYGTDIYSHILLGYPAGILNAHPVILSAAKDLLFPGLLPVPRVKSFLRHGCLLLSSFRYAFGS
jgi:hypothetical protein